MFNAYPLLIAMEKGTSLWTPLATGGLPSKTLLVRVGPTLIRFVNLPFMYLLPGAYRPGDDLSNVCLTTSTIVVISALAIRTAYCVIGTAYNAMEGIASSVTQYYDILSAHLKRLHESAQDVWADQVISEQRFEEESSMENQLVRWRAIKSATPFERLYHSDKRYHNGPQFKRLNRKGQSSKNHLAGALERKAVLKYFKHLCLSYGKVPYWNQISPTKFREGAVGHKLTHWPKDLRCDSKNDVFDPKKHIYCIIDNSYVNLPDLLLSLPAETMVFIYDYQFRCHGKLDNNGIYYVKDDKVLTRLSGSPDITYTEKPWMLEGDAINVFGPIQKYQAGVSFNEQILSASWRPWTWILGKLLTIPLMFVNQIGERYFGTTLFPGYSFVFKRYRIYKQTEGLAPARSMRFILPVSAPRIGLAALLLHERCYNTNEDLRRQTFADLNAPGYNRVEHCNEDLIASKDSKDPFKLQNKGAVRFQNVQRNGCPDSIDIPDELFQACMSYAHSRTNKKATPNVAMFKTMIVTFYLDHMPKHHLSDFEKHKMAEMMGGYCFANCDKRYSAIDYTQYSNDWLNTKHEGDASQSIYTYKQEVQFHSKYSDWLAYKSCLKEWNMPLLDQLPAVPSRAKQNDLAATLLRGVMPQFELRDGPIPFNKDIHVNNPNFPSDLLELILSIPSLIVTTRENDGQGKLQPLSLDEIEDLQNSSIRKQRFDAGSVDPSAFNQPKLPPPQRKDYRMTFVKAESYGTDGKHPRIITPCDTNEVLCLFTKYFYPFVKAHMSPQDWYGFGKTPEEIADQVAKICCEPGVEFVNLGDLSRCDGRACTAIFQLELYCLLYAYDEQYHDEISTLFRSSVFRTTKVCGFLLPTLGSRPSGYPDTSAGNTLEVLCIDLLAIMRHRSVGPKEAYAIFERTSIIGGDDCLLGGTPAIYLTEAASDLGAIAASTIVPQGQPGVEFLGRTYTERVWYGDPTSHTDLKRQLLKLHLGWKENVGTRAYYGFLKCRAYNMTDGWTPILGPYTRNYCIAYLGLFDHPFVQSITMTAHGIVGNAPSLFKHIDIARDTNHDNYEVKLITNGRDQIRSSAHVTHWEQFPYSSTWPQRGPFQLLEEESFVRDGFDLGHFNNTLEHCYELAHRMFRHLGKSSDELTDEDRLQIVRPYLDYAFSCPADAYVLVDKDPICDFHSSFLGDVKGSYGSLGQIKFGTSSQLEDLEFRPDGTVNNRRKGAPTGIRQPPGVDIHRTYFWPNGVMEKLFRHQMGKEAIHRVEPSGSPRDDSKHRPTSASTTSTRSFDSGESTGKSRLRHRKKKFPVPALVAPDRAVETRDQAAPD